MKKTEQTLGQRLAAAREKLNITQEELSRISRVPRNTIQNIEYDKVSPRLDNLNALASVLNVSLDSLANSNQPRIDPDWAEAARVLHALSEVSLERRLSVLYLLLKDEAYLLSLQKLPGCAPVAQALKKVP